MEAKYIAVTFVDAINSHDVAALALLMSDTHVLVDTQGKRLQGCDILRAAWRDFFVWFPDYHIEIERIVVDGDFVVLIGSASGTYSDNSRWSIPTVWTAQICGCRVSEWRVYADGAPVCQLLQN